MKETLTLTQDQTERLGRMFMIFGNDGMRHTHANHSFLRSILERGEYHYDAELWRPDRDLRESVDGVLGLTKIHPSIDGLPASLRLKVASVSDERPLDGFWVYLKAGFKNTEAGTHCFHERTPRDTVARLKRETGACTCDQCHSITTIHT